MAKVYHEEDADLVHLKGKKIAIIGYGSQGHAHALNLQDSGLDVVVGLYKGSKSWEKATKAGLKVATVEEASSQAQVIMILVPDQTQRSLFETSIRPNLTEGKTLMFSHGFNIHFNQVVPPANVDVSMIAPKGPGHMVRDVFVEGTGVPAPSLNTSRTRCPGAFGATIVTSTSFGGTIQLNRIAKPCANISILPAVSCCSISDL